MARVVLITGVSRYLGARVASVLQAEPSLDRVIGIDAVPPTAAGSALGRTEFVQVDMRAGGISGILSSAEVDTVVHAGLATMPQSVGGRPAMKDINVVGTMQLLAACQRAPAVRKLVVRSTTAVYGCSHRDPALFTEETEPHAILLGGLTKDATQVEGHVRGFARRRPDVAVSTLRFASFLGPGVDSAFARYFSLPSIPAILGFDPRLQFLHIDDGVDVVRRMTVEDHPGTFNVAADGIITLGQAVRRIGRPAFRLPGPALRLGGELARSFETLDFSPEQVELLRYGRVVDTSRIKDELGWSPRYTSLEAFDDFVRARNAHG
ncbi:MAG: NAD-dependent epimerase/dehydratase family protein [Streptosporangiales bacterium]|nr:NAD-dependent epimerase/dehydratase family protein [Streptosporangiales bacterium]